jgi:hypothetical protein
VSEGRSFNFSDIIGNNTDIVLIGVVILAGIVMFGKTDIDFVLILSVCEDPM